MSLKSFRKFIIGIILVWVIVLAAGLLFSRSFQTKIISVLSEQADKHLAAEIHIRKSDIHFSVFKKFPLASVELRNVMVKIPSQVDLRSVRAEHSDTLLFAKKLYLQMNLRSLLNKEYQLQKISVNDGFIQVLSDRNGNSSLNIIKPGGSNKDFEANIQSFSLSNVKLFSNSANSKFRSKVNVKKGEVSGAFSKSNFAVDIKSNGIIEEVLVQGEKLKPMQNYKIDIAVDRSEETYSIRKGYYSISNIPMKVVGKIKTSKSTYIDLIFSAQNVSLKQVDNSFLNGLIGRTGFETKAGKLSLQATAKGYIQNSSPTILANFTISEAKILDKEKNLSYTNIYLDGNINNGNTQQFQKPFSIQVDSFDITLGKSNQYGHLSISNLQSPKIWANMQGVIDINDLKGQIEIPEVSFPQGIIKNKIQLAGLLPQKGKNKTGNLNLKGQFYLKDFHIQLEKVKLPLLRINGLVTMLNNNTLAFDSVLCQAANSDLKIIGTLNNFRSKTSIPVFAGSISSTDLYMTDFISLDPNTAKTTKEIQFPDSVEVKGNVEIKNFYFGNFTPHNIGGLVNYKNKTLQVDGFTMKAFSGSVSGNILIKQTKYIYLSAKAFVRKNSIEEMFFGFNNFGQTVISGEHLNGQLSGTLHYSSNWSNTLKIDKESIHAQGNILLENGELKDYDPLLGLSKFIEVEELKHIRFDNLTTNIGIQNRKVILDQTHIASSAINFDGSGIHDFDNKYEYRLQVGLSDILWKKARKKKKDISEFGYIVDDNTGHTTIPFLITGKGTTFNVKYDKRTSRTSFREKVAQEREELKDLFHNEPVQIEPTAIGPEEEVKEETKPVLEKTDSGTYRNKNDEFILDWDDSEDDEE